VKKIELSRGLVALIDDEDYPAISQFKWTASARNYAYRVTQDSGKQSYHALHREIMGLQSGDSREVDHIDGDGLNNQRANLRICSHAENTLNRRMSKRNTSGFKGVTWSKCNRRWQAQIMIGGKQKWLGLYDSPEIAHAAYKAAADALHGEFANHGIIRASNA